MEDKFSFLFFLPCPMLLSLSVHQDAEKGVAEKFPVPPNSQNLTK